MNSASDVISATQALQLLCHSQSVRCVDVRSEGEALRGSIRGFENLPILNNVERHQIGICYKEQGSEAAISLGHELVKDSKADRIRKWCESLQNVDWPLVCCWRGGLRSQIATQWIQEAGINALRIGGGYKVLRNELLLALRKPPSFYVISGATGSGKTKLLEAAAVPQINLEKLAVHRGSAFGANLTSEQPSQATFENEIAMDLLSSAAASVCFVEDESVMIGRLRLPEALNRAIQTSPVIRLHASIAARTENLWREYVLLPLQQGHAPNQLGAHYKRCVDRVRNKLGGAKHQQITQWMDQAFLEHRNELHLQWIRELLEHYYDKAYRYGELQLNRPVLFEGEWDACLSWMKNRFA